MESKSSKEGHAEVGAGEGDTVMPSNRLVWGFFTVIPEKISEGGCAFPAEEEFEELVGEGEGDGFLEPEGLACKAFAFDLARRLSFLCSAGVRATGAGVFGMFSLGGE